MKKENNKMKIAALASGAAMLGAFTSTASANELLNFEDLGTGSELRSNLITADALSAFTNNTDVEFECGEGKCGEGKCGEGKCGEGKCGEKGEQKSESSEQTENKAEVKEAEKTQQTNNNEMMMNSQQGQQKEQKTEKKADPQN